MYSQLSKFLPHKWTRVWLRGLRFDAAGFAFNIPLPLVTLGSPAVRLSGLLGRGAPNIQNADNMTVKQRENLKEYLEKIVGGVASGVAGEIGVFLGTKGQPVMLVSTAEASLPINDAAGRKGGLSVPYRRGAVPSCGAPCGPLLLYDRALPRKSSHGEHFRSPDALCGCCPDAFSARRQPGRR